MTSSEIGICISIVVYLAAMVVIGYFCSKKNNDSGDFYLGGRKLGPLVTAMSAEASDMSGWLLMGLPGVALLIKGFSYGSIAEAVWTALGLALGTYVNWLIVAKKLRRYSEAAGNSLTVPEFFSNRFGDKSNILRAIGAVIIIVFFIPYTASGFSACGKLFASLFSLDYLPSMIVSAIVIVLYTTMGGFLAASTTDFIQSIIMTGALAIILGYGIVHGGGIGEIISNAKAVPGYFSLVSQVSADGAVSSYNGLTIASTLAWGLGYFGMPHILLRFMAIEDENKLKLSRRIASSWVVIAMFIAISIGIIGYSLVTNGTVADITDGETIIVKIVGVISENGFIPALIAGLILAGILASTMSTADSQLLAAASSISEDIVQGLFKIKLSKKAAMIIARVTVIVISLIGMFIARDANSSVFNIVSFAWAGFGASFGPLVLFALFWRRSNKWGALAGMISGGIMVFVWKYLVRPLGGLLDIYELLPAFIVSCIFIVVVSLLTKAPDKEITDVFDRVSK
ncbi:MAG: sodium/proline symporter PutP [Clostridia bacterium]|nr:sodium/proline symporter PutP [Clostridia bacterium]